ncbi:MAG: sulfite exporter TauE/SafE family protein [Peptococcaceae bacterium]|nr:sulfite exporter TauE/SafE family protein [Peptococcaceae bacterium]
MFEKRRLYKASVVILVILLSGLVFGTLASGAQVGSDLGLGGKLGAAIAKAPAGTGAGQIDPNAPRGFLGIPGAPKINPVVAFLWAVWVGWIFSTVGAFGGIMAGVGHMTIFGLGDYTKAFKKTAPELNKVMTDCIRMSNQWLVGLSSAISSLNYLRAKRLAWPLGLALGLGSLFGAVVIPMVTGGKISFSQYQGWFGIAVFVVGGFLLYETTPKGQAGKKAAKAAAQAFEKSVKEKGEGDTQGIKVTKWGLGRIEFSFFGAEFGFNPILAFVGGVIIAGISSFLGVGGGFLYVPYLTSLVGLPMFVVAGTSALAVLASMVMSITSYLNFTGAAVDWALIGTELIGVFIGSMIGPRTQKYIPDIWLKRIFVLLALYVGLGYFSKGFFGTAWVPM